MSNRLSGRLKLSFCLASVALFFLSSQSISSVITRYARDIGASIALTGFIWSIAFLASLLIKPTAGYLADKVGSYKLMGAGALALAFSCLLYKILSFNALLAGRLMQGIATGFL